MPGGKRNGEAMRSCLMEALQRTDGNTAPGADRPGVFFRMRAAYSLRKWQFFVKSGPYTGFGMDKKRILRYNIMYIGMLMGPREDSLRWNSTTAA